MEEWSTEPLPEYLRLLLKFTLPKIEEEENNETGAKEKEEDDTDVRKHWGTVDGRLLALEGKFDQVMSLLTALLAKNQVSE